MDKSSLKPGHLRRIKSLALFNDEQLKAFLDYVDVVNCEQSATLFREGQSGDSMYLILDGQMRIYTKRKNGEIVMLRMLEAGDAFGEVALMNQAPRSASAEAVRNTILVKISASKLKKLVDDEPAIAAQFLYHQARVLGRQLTDLTGKVRAFRDNADMFSFLQ